jgi:hypothetical protein
MYTLRRREYLCLDVSSCHKICYCRQLHAWRGDKQDRRSVEVALQVEYMLKVIRATDDPLPHAWFHSNKGVRRGDKLSTEGDLLPLRSGGGYQSSMAKKN